MNRSLILIFALLAVAFAKPKDIYVGCDCDDAEALKQENHFGPTEFKYAAIYANDFVSSKIHVCCSIDVVCESFPEFIIFDNEVEIIGSEPNSGTCPTGLNTEAKSFAALQLPRPTSCKGGDCSQAISRMMKVEDYEDDCEALPVAWIRSFGITYQFQHKGKFVRIGLLADFVPENKVIPKMPEQLKHVNGSKMLKNLADGVFDLVNLEFPFPNRIFCASVEGGPCDEFSIEESILGMTFCAFEETLSCKEPWLTWVLFFNAYQLRIDKSLVFGFDFHLALRYATSVHVDHTILVFLDDLIDDLIEEYLDAAKMFKSIAAPKKKVGQSGPLRAQLHFKVEDSAIIFFDVKDELIVGPADLGLLPIVLDSFIPEVHYIHLDDVFWFNFDRIVAAGSICRLETQGWDWQEAKIDDFVFLDVEL